MVNLKTLNKLYNVLDLYIVSSRIEVVQSNFRSFIEAPITQQMLVYTRNIK